MEAMARLVVDMVEATAAAKWAVVEVAIRSSSPT
jgi:hypothetical protein